MSDLILLEKGSKEYHIIDKLIEENHQHLQEANFIILLNEKIKLKGDIVVIAEVKKTSPSEKIIHNYDFKIIIYDYVWGKLDDKKKISVLDHELTHCGVKYIPLKEKNEETGKTEVVKDEFGRKQYTNEIDRDDNGRPKWVILPHDLEEFRSIVKRHGMYDESIQEFAKIVNQESKISS